MSESEKSFQRKVGFFICSGCQIGERADVDAAAQVARKEFRLDIVESDPFLCGPAGIARIKKSIEANGLNAVSVAACSPRVMSDRFDFGKDVIVDRIDIREKGVWRATENEAKEDTDALVQDYVRMGIARINATEPTVPTIDPATRRALVIGAGVTGMNCARQIAEAGIEVELIEKSSELGGFMKKSSARLPYRAPFERLEENDLSELIETIERDEKISIHLNSRVESISGAPGAFDVTLRNGAPESERFKVGAVVVATGWTPYDKSALTHLGSDLADVITNVEMERILSSEEGPLTRRSDGEQARSALFIQCAGSREAARLAYCSSVCCSMSLKQALIARERDPELNVVIVYKDIRTPGFGEFFYKKAQEDPGIFLLKGEVESVRERDGMIEVVARDTLLGESTLFSVDLVTLATGMVSSTHDATVTVDKPEEELTERDLLRIGKSDVLKLTYRKGAELPHLSEKYKFPDSHFICFPYETTRTGIYVAGPARAPSDSETAARDGAGAALKAIQAINMVGQGKSVHPRAGDMSYPEFFLQRCTQCKRCTEECPFGTLDEDEKGTPKPNPTRCRRCGVCMGACPERIISFKNYSVAMISSMIKSMEIPDEFSEKLRILIFACENDAMPALEMAGFNRIGYDAQTRIIPLRCLGSLNLVWVADALSSGVDGIIMLGCAHGDDYQCHFVKGSELATTRMSKAQETLDRLQLESERILVESAAINDYKRLPELINQFAVKLGEMEPNPYKGF